MAASELSVIVALTDCFIGIGIGIGIGMDSNGSHHSRHAPVDIETKPWVVGEHAWACNMREREQM